MLNLHSLQEYRTKLKECERDLQDLIEAPQPLKVQPLSKAEQEQHDQGVCKIYNLKLQECIQMLYVCISSKNAITRFPVTGTNQKNFISWKVNR